MQTAPVALFVYNRPDHTRRTVEALLSNALADQSDLVIFSDGPKNEEAVQSVEAVRRYVKGISGFRSCRVVERDENWGLAKSIIAGVSTIVDEFGRIIVMEDDLVSSPWFLRFMNEGLEVYKDDERVISIHGYTPNIVGLPAIYFLKGADCWGWATWKRGWKLFNPDATALQRVLINKGLMKRFDFNGTYDYSGMLERQIRGKIDSWAIRWYASALAEDTLTLHPGTSLISNIGFDGSGTHGDIGTGEWDTKPEGEYLRVDGIAVEETEKALELVVRYFHKHRKDPIIRAKGWLVRLFRRFHTH